MKRRTNGMGTLYLRKDGRYEASTFATLPDGRRKRTHGYGPTAAIALRKLNDKLLLIQLETATTSKLFITKRISTE